MPATPAIEFRNVSLAFDEKPVLSDISFQVEKGGTLILLGVTGSGKSVLLKLILGLLRPDQGQILVEGRDLTPLSEEQLHPLRKRMGIVFQEGALFDSLTVRENVAYRFREEGINDEDAIERRVREVLRFVEMEEAIEKMPADLSGGMRRRVSIARALVSDPAIMLYDSPTAGLDPVTSNTIIVQIAKLRDVQHVTSIVVTHRLQDSFMLANFAYSEREQTLTPAPSGDHGGPRATTRFMVLRGGQVYFAGSEKELVQATDPYLKKFLA